MKFETRLNAKKKIMNRAVIAVTTDQMPENTTKF